MRQIQLSRGISESRVPGEIAGDPVQVHRRLEVTVEREVISVLNNSSVLSFSAFCENCFRDVTMLTPEVSAAAAGTTPRAIYRWVEENRLHFVEPGFGKLFICSESLQALKRALQISSGELR